MPQRLVPVSDVSAGGWTPTPVYVEIDEESPSDADQVESPEISTCEGFSVAVTEAAKPPVDTTGDHTVSAHLKKSGEGCVKATVTLLEGGSLIAYRDYDLTDDWQTYSYTLSPEEAASIDDYETLQVAITERVE